MRQQLGCYPRMVSTSGKDFGGVLLAIEAIGGSY